MLVTPQAFAQSPTNAVTITVVQPDGSQAQDATVLIVRDPPLWASNSPEYSVHPPTLSGRTGADGSCRITPLKDHYRIVVTHRTGSAARTAREVRDHPTLKLEPWARVEGVVRAAGRPLPNEPITLQSPVHYGEFGSPSIRQLKWESATDAQGRFAFTNLAPGDYLLYRTPFPVRASRKQSHRWPFVLRPGETQRIDYTFGGRTVVGRAEAGDLVDWQNDWHALAAKAAALTNERWPDRGAMDAQELDKAREAWASSEEHLAAERRFQVFQLVFDPDGNFRARDVPPGTYELRLRLTKPPATAQGPPGPREDLGGLTNTVTIPPGPAGEPFDLGTLEVPLRSGATPKPPLSFKATRLDGGEFDTAQHRGRPAVLVFWADWAPTAAAWLRDLHTLRGALTNADRVTWASVNLGDPKDTARAGTAALAGGWTHTQLSGETLVEAAEKIGLHTVPATFLLDPSGRVIARDPDLPRLRGNLQRILQTAKP